MADHSGYTPLAVALITAQAHGDTATVDTIFRVQEELDLCALAGALSGLARGALTELAEQRGETFDVLLQQLGAAAAGSGDADG